MRPRQRIAQPESVRRDQDQMHMVRHQAIGEHLGTTDATRDRQQTAILRVILIAEKGLLAPIASLCHMMGQSWHNHSRESCDPSILTLNQQVSTAPFCSGYPPSPLT
jgi:hypothetical protein